MYTIAMAYCGTASNSAIQRLLHMAASDVDPDVHKCGVKPQRKQVKVDLDDIKAQLAKITNQSLDSSEEEADNVEIKPAPSMSEAKENKSNDNNEEEPFRGFTAVRNYFSFLTTI